MILAEVRNYLAERKRVTLRDLVYRFEVDAEALRGMLAMLQRKGKVRQLPSESGCGARCDKCDATSLELFEWVEPTGR